ncbi:unknown [Eubacterium sp. CAG:274]|nr:unknown [Eubacterium sp. CAG:274]
MLPSGYVQNDKLEIPEYIKNMSDEELKKAIAELEKEIKESRGIKNQEV